MCKWHAMLKCSLCISLLFSLGSIFAQEPHALQARLEGSWTEDNNNDDRQMQQLLFLNGAEKNLNATGEDFRAAYRPEEDPAASCPMAGALVGRATDFQILDRGDRLEIVAFGRTRRVHMDYALEPPATFTPNLLGWSVGRWAGDMLVVRTTRFSDGTVNSGGRPLPFGGPTAQMVERYTLSEDQNSLLVDINLNDPKYYSFSLNARRYYVRTDDIPHDNDCD